MAKAHKAPDYTYVRRFTITRHALDRFRERVDEEFRSRNDEDLGNLLDERLRHAESTIVTDLSVADKQTLVYVIASRNGTKYYAIVRELTVVTVLDEHMLEANFESGRWKRTAMNTPFAVLKDTMKHKPTPVAVAKPLPVNLKIENLGSALAARMLEYASTDADVVDMQRRITELQEAMVPLVEKRERAEHAVKEAQEALQTAITNAARRAT